MSLLRRGSTRGWRLRQGEPAPLQGRPGRRCCTARERGWPPGPVRPAAPALQGSRFAVSVRPSRPVFTNRSARFHPAACSLLFLVSLPSSPATRGVMSRMWTRRCHTRYVGAARGSRWVLCLHFGHPQPRKQATLILGGECSAQERHRGEKCSAV